MNILLFSYNDMFHQTHYIRCESLQEYMFNIKNLISIIGRSL